MLSAYETGKQRPSFATIDKILAALDSDARDLTAALLALDSSVQDPEDKRIGNSARVRANQEAVLSVEAEVRTLVGNLAEDWTAEELSILSRAAITLIWVLRQAKSS